MSVGSLLSVVIPALDEAIHLQALLEDLGRALPTADVIVADGGSRDDTVGVARRKHARVLESERGRAAQMNAGAALSEAEWLLFLHADSRLDERAGKALETFLQSAPPSGVAGAYFEFAFDAEGGLLPAVEWGQRIRERLTGLVYGDQGLLVRRSDYEAVGGHPEQPLMEDVEIVRRLRRRGRLVRLPARLRTSARRYRRRGVLRTSLRNLTLITGYHLGVSAERLVRWYPVEPSGTPEGRVLLVFAKLPEPGRVKTRLARTMGDRAAARIYSTIARSVVRSVRGGPYEVVVCYDPPDRGAEVERWLDMEGIHLWPQGSGDLGARMAGAFERAFEQAREVCIIGTDAPDVDRSLVTTAFAQLDGAPMVLGPAEDGGYYLLALSRPQSELFRGIEWSTDRVAAQTRERASALGLTVYELPVLSDVDEPADVPEDLVV